MSARKSERLVNLLIALLSTRRYLSREELRELVEGYRGSSQTAFERQFERDKEELRRIGIAIETGSNDPYSDEEHGYRVNRSEFELPAISFTPAELAALGLAGQVWQDSIAAADTAQAFEALRAAGAAPDPSLIPAVRPQVEVREPDFDVVYQAVLSRTEITFGYAGKTRRLLPWRILQRRGRWYVIGHDLDRSAMRHFKLSRFTSRAETRGKPGAYELPADVDQLALSLEPSADASAVVALRDGAAREWHGAFPATWEAPLPDGFVAYEVRMHSQRAIVDEVAAAGTEAILLAPDEARKALIHRLRGIAS